MVKDVDKSSKEQTELMKSLEKRFAELDAKLSASGPTVEVMKPSDSGNFTVTFPRKTEQK
jgi:hypothetical protein